jgi:hypothetical protein
MYAQAAGIYQGRFKIAINGNFEEIAKAPGLREDRLRHGLGAAYGIGRNRDGKGVITLVLPEGVPAEALIAGEAKAAAKGSRNPEREVKGNGNHYTMGCVELDYVDGPGVGCRCGQCLPDRRGVSRRPQVTRRPSRYPATLLRRRGSPAVYTVARAAGAVPPHRTLHGGKQAAGPAVGNGFRDGPPSATTAFSCLS